MTAKEYLSQIEKLDRLIENKVADMKKWQSIAYGLPGIGKTVKINGEVHLMDKVQSTGNPQKMAEAVANYSDLEEEIEELRKKRAEIIKTLERLDPVEYDVLYTIYVQGYTLSRAAKKIYKSYRHTLRIRDRAFLNIQKLIDGE